MSAAVAFGPTANPEAYVPWSGSERALAQLERWASAGPTPICLLAGAPGMGKTLILKLLATRTASALRSIPVTYPDCDPGTLCAVLLEHLDGPVLGTAPADLLDALGADGSPPTLVLVDEGDLLPIETAGFLRDLAARVAGRLRVAVAVTRDERRAELEALFGADAVTVAIEGTMSKAEVATHVRTQLARASVDPRLGARFDRSTLARLHEKSEGVPASLQSLAAGLLFEAQRTHGEIRLPAIEAARALPTDGVETAPREIELAGATGPPRRRARSPIFALGITLGVVGGIAVAELGPRLLAMRSAASAAAPRESAPALPAVAAAPPPAVVAAEQPAPAAALPAPSPVAVSFNADPWARIEVDGELAGVTPIAAHPVAPGRHRVTAHLADGRVLDRELEIDASNRHIVFP